MYRLLQQELDIYCPRGGWCDRRANCNQFHFRPPSGKHGSEHSAPIAGKNGEGAVKSLVRAIESSSANRIEKQRQSAASSTSSTSPQDPLPPPMKMPLRVDLHQKQSLGPVPNIALQAATPTTPTPVSSGGGGARSNGSAVAAAVPVSNNNDGVSPGVVSNTSGMSKAESNVTLDDIIASARRKISEDFEELRIPSPELIPVGEEALGPTVAIGGERAGSGGVAGSGRSSRRSGGKPPLLPESSLDLPAPDTAELAFASSERLLEFRFSDYDSEAEMLQGDIPPTYIGVGDEDKEDFEEMLHATKTDDPKSNPILVRAEDPLTGRKKHKKLGGASPKRQDSKMVLLQQALNSSANTSQRNSPNLEEDNSSVVIKREGSDRNLLNGGLVPTDSPAQSSDGSNEKTNLGIMQFIDEQKRRASHFVHQQSVANGNGEGNKDASNGVEVNGHA